MDGSWNNAEILVGTAWNNDKPGMYGVNKNFTPWEKLEARGILEVKDGRLLTEISEEDGNIHTLDTIKGTLIIPETVTDIDDEVFSYCRLHNVIIPDSVKSIGENAFSHCPLDSIKIPGSVETIGKNAFEEVDHIEYYGKAAYEPFNKYWGAHSMN